MNSQNSFKCVIKHVRNNGSTKRMRYKTEFDAAAKHAIQTNTDEEPTVVIELTITHWRFTKKWRSDLFMEAYTRDPPTNDEDNDDDANEVLSLQHEANDEETQETSQTRTYDAKMMELLEGQRALFEKLSETAIHSGARNNGANNQATLALPWNPGTLPSTMVQERYNGREKFLTSAEMKSFEITSTDATGNETTVRQNYYIHYYFPSESGLLRV
eukprot:jgi/Psemu1/53928/gm1.53928_g